MKITVKANFSTRIVQEMGGRSYSSKANFTDRMEVVHKNKSFRNDTGLLPVLVAAGKAEW
jgi:hypothetical protein